MMTIGGVDLKSFPKEMLFTPMSRFFLFKKQLESREIKHGIKI